MTKFVLLENKRECLDVFKSKEDRGTGRWIRRPDVHPHPFSLPRTRGPPVLGFPRTYERKGGAPVRTGVPFYPFRREYNGF